MWAVSIFSGGLRKDLHDSNAEAEHADPSSYRSCSGLPLMPRDVK